MACTHCGEIQVIARGLCSPCYYRLRRSGSVARKNVQNAGRVCAFGGCIETAHAKGFCALHYARQFHPLRNTWKLIRSRYPRDIPARWDRFEVFLDDVGERAGERHQLRRIDESKPYSKTNIRWVAPVKKSRTGSYSKDERAAYVRDWALQRKFGIDATEYDKMLKAQNGRCAICGNAETFFNRGKKEKQALSVDHCHDTGKVRGLLCVRCNRGLGYFRDRPEFLRRAIEYLK